MFRNARGATTRAQPPAAPAADAQIQGACAVEVHMDDVESHECTVNSSESAAHARAEQRSKHTFLSPTVRTPQCAHTVWGNTLNKALTMSWFSCLTPEDHNSFAHVVSEPNQVAASSTLPVCAS